MQRFVSSRRSPWILAIFVLAALLTGAQAAAQQEAVLHNFGNGTDGSGPWGGLVADKAGNLYGVTLNGGLYGAGSVFELESTGGGWAEKVLHSFNVNVGVGEGYPSGSLAFDAKGNLYGTTTVGNNGCGTVYELQPNGSGGWKEKVLYGFSQGSGYDPQAGVIIDAAGNLYGTTLYTGTNGKGTVFELKPGPGGTWTHKVLHNFHDNHIDGYEPSGGLVMDASGNLYGATSLGGSGTGWGTVFELTPTSKTSWTETVLVNFSKGVNGAGPTGSLILDSAGNLYGATGAGDGGVDGAGVVFKLSPNGDGTWADTFLYVLPASGVDGWGATGSLTFDSAGNLYGVASYGGAYGASGQFIGGTVFELSPTSTGMWNETTLHSFGNGTDGFIPFGGLIVAQDGNLYGTTSGGGLYGGPDGSAGQGGIGFALTP